MYSPATTDIYHINELAETLLQEQPVLPKQS